MTFDCPILRQLTIISLKVILIGLEKSIFKTILKSNVWWGIDRQIIGSKFNEDTPERLLHLDFFKE